MHPRPGEIWLADLGLAAKTRPVVIVSRFDPDAPRALIIYVPLTTQNRESSYEVPLPRLSFLNAASVANVQGIASIPLVRLERRIGTLPENTFGEIRRALLLALDLDSSGK
jgi:mRNA interferase MazF